MQVRLDTQLWPSQLALGSANVDQKTVDLVQQVIFDSISESSYLSLIDRYNSTCKPQNDRLWSQFEASESMPKPAQASVFSIPPNVLSNYGNRAQLLAEKRFIARIYYDLSKLEETDSIGALVIPLSNKISELGFPCDSVEIRVEQGCLFNSTATNWHYDGDAVTDSIIVNFSNNANWSTRLIDNKDKIDILGEGDEMAFMQKKINETALEKLEAVSQAAEIGYLYDAKKTLHRAPHHEDFGGEELAANDYRLLLQFNAYPD